MHKNVKNVGIVTFISMINAMSENLNACNKCTSRYNQNLNLFH